MAYKKICMLDRVYHGLGWIITYLFCCFECCERLLVKIPDIYENMNRLKVRIIDYYATFFVNDNLWIKEKPYLQSFLNAVEN